MPAVPVGWHADLREPQDRSALRRLNIEDGNRVVVGPPTRGAPRLDDFGAGLQRQIESGDVPVPGGEPAGDFAADGRLLPRKRLVLCRVHQQFIDFSRGGLKPDGLLNRFRFHLASFRLFVIDPFCFLE